MKTKNSKRPFCGIGVMVFKDKKILMSKRKNTFAKDCYQFPGGHLEFGETFEQCAKREVMEEAGIEIKNIRFQFVTNVKNYHKRHFVHIGLIADWKKGIPKAMESKSGKWDWYDIKNPPKPLFEFCRLTFESYKKGKSLY